MRVMMMVVLALAAGAATPALAEPVSRSGSPPQYASSLRSFSDCYRLGWVRGVHVERDELADWNEQCMVGRIPFNSGSQADSIVTESK